MGTQSIAEKLKMKRERLDAYIAREAFMLSEDGVRSYSVGSLTLSRYNTALGDIRKAIETLEDEIAELETLQAGKSPRRVMRIIPRF